MIRPDQIPDEVVDAAARANAERLGVRWGDAGNFIRDGWRGDARAAIAAALNAWPDGCIGESECGWHRYIELPLPQETT